PPLCVTPFPYTTLFRSVRLAEARVALAERLDQFIGRGPQIVRLASGHADLDTVSEGAVAVHRAVAAFGCEGHAVVARQLTPVRRDRKSTRLNSSHQIIS